MSAVLLTVAEVANLENIKEDSVTAKIRRGTLKAIKMGTSTGAGHGFEYAIDLQDLSEKTQRKYHKRLKEQAAALLPEPEPVAAEQTLEQLTDKQRQQAVAWEKIIKDWRRYVGLEHGEMQQRTREFIKLYNIQNPDNPIKERTLYNKWEAYRIHGLAGLADKRGQSGKKGSSSIP